MTKTSYLVILFMLILNKGMCKIKKVILEYILMELNLFPYFVVNISCSHISKCYTIQI